MLGVYSPLCYAGVYSPLRYIPISWGEGGGCIPCALDPCLRSCLQCDLDEYNTKCTEVLSSSAIFNEGPGSVKGGGEGGRGLTR